MIKFGALALSAMLLAGGAAGLVKQPAQEEVFYRDSYDITYDESGSSNAIIESLSVTYSTRTRDTYAQALKFPNYDYAPAVSACAAVAGANLVGFFDRYDENLIPNHSSGTAVGTTYIYSSEDSAVQAVIRELYSYMGTTATGTTEKKFKLLQGQGSRHHLYFLYAGRFVQLFAGAELFKTKPTHRLIFKRLQRDDHDGKQQ